MSNRSKAFRLGRDKRKPAPEYEQVGPTWEE